MKFDPDAEVIITDKGKKRFAQLSANITLGFELDIEECGELRVLLDILKLSHLITGEAQQLFDRVEEYLKNNNS